MQVVYFVKSSMRIDAYVWVVVLLAGEMLGIVKKGKRESHSKGASLSWSPGAAGTQFH